VTVGEQSPHQPTTSGFGDVRARLMLVLLCLLWGITWPVMKIALEDIPPLSMRTISTLFGALTLLLICAATRRRLPIAGAKVWAHVIVISLLNIGLFSILSAYAQATAATTRVTILVYTMPIWAVLLAWAMLRERPKASQSLAVALCVLGLGVLIYPLAATGVPLGLVLAVVAGFSWGAGTVYIKWAGLPFDPLVLAFWQLVVAFAVVGASLFVVDGRLNLDHAHATSILAAAFAGIAGSALAYTMWFEIVRRLPAATASLGVLGIPVVGVVSTVLVTGERLSGADIIGFALIFAASACVLLAPSAPAKA